LDYSSSEKVEADNGKAYLLKIAHEALEYAEIEGTVFRGAQLGIDLLCFRPSLHLDESLKIGIQGAWLIEMNGGERPAHGDPSFGRPATVVHGHRSKDVQIGGAGLC
jgi:hypothetical protein